MKSSLVLLSLASVFVVGCGGLSPIAPDAASAPGLTSSVSATDSGAARPFFPPINPSGISCPSDAPQIAVSSFGLRMDIDFSEVAGANAYEIQILDYFGRITRLEIPAPAHHAEWYGGTVDNAYRVKLRTINCGGLGNWSESVYHALQDDRQAPPPTQPPTEPKCTVEGCTPPPPAEPKCTTEGCTPPPPTEPHCTAGGCTPPAPPPPIEPRCFRGCY